MTANNFAVASTETINLIKGKTWTEKETLYSDLANAIVSKGRNILPFRDSELCSAGLLFSAANMSLPSPSSFDRNDSTFSSKEPTSPKGSRSAYHKSEIILVIYGVLILHLYCQLCKEIPSDLKMKQFQLHQ